MRSDPAGRRGCGPAARRPHSTSLRQVHADVAARDAEPVHHVVHRERFAGDVEQAVNAGHRRVDAPERTHGAPEVDELAFDLGEAGGQGRRHEF